MDGEALTPGGSGPGKEDCIAFAVSFLQYIKNCFIIKIAIVVVHFGRIGTVPIHDIGRNAFSKIGFETIRPHFNQCA